MTNKDRVLSKTEKMPKTHDVYKFCVTVETSNLGRIRKVSEKKKSSVLGVQRGRSCMR